MTKKNHSLQIMTITAIMAALSAVLMIFDFPFFNFFPSFLKFDFSDLPALIVAFLYGPVAGVIVELVKNVVHGLLMSTTGGVGELANFIVGAVFVFAAGSIYNVLKAREGESNAAYRRTEWLDREYCPHCKKELSVKSGECASCGKALSGVDSPENKSGFLSLPKKFWMIIIGFVPLAVLAFLGWALVPDSENVSYNAFTVWFKLRDTFLTTLDSISDKLDSFGIKAQEFADLQATADITLNVIALAVTILFAVSLVLLVLSLVLHKNKARAMLAYCGFGANTFASIAFLVASMVINQKLSDLTNGEFSTVLTVTAIPLIACFIAVVGIILLVKRPRATVIAMTTGSISMIVVAAIVNYFILIPFFIQVMGFPEMAIVGMSKAIIPWVKDMLGVIIFSIVPFNLLKAIIVSILTFAVYKRIGNALSKIAERNR
ncbi:hypothetical protein FACS1894105_01100 [Clostridia bacterium]|nr:hypothetical protein FACS1894105_01100 [Clostridia bacterium]